MIITHYKQAGIIISTPSLDIAVNVNADYKNKLEKIKKGIFITSLHNKAYTTTPLSDQHIVIDGPGEYETSGVIIKGHGVRATVGGKTYINTLYALELEGIDIWFCNCLTSTTALDKLTEELGNCDVLVVPIGGGDVLGVASALQFADATAASIIIPTHYYTNMSALKKVSVSESAGTSFTLKQKNIKKDTQQYIAIDYS